MGRVELLGFIEKKGSRAKGSKTNDRKVARTDDRVDTSLPLLIFPFILSDPLRWVENQWQMSRVNQKQKGRVGIGLKTNDKWVAWTKIKRGRVGIARERLQTPSSKKEFWEKCWRRFLCPTFTVTECGTSMRPTGLSVLQSLWYWMNSYSPSSLKFTRAIIQYYEGIKQELQSLEDWTLNTFYFLNFKKALWVKKKTNINCKFFICEIKHWWLFQ